MPLTKNSPISIVATTSPAAGWTGTKFEASLIDHLQMFVAFTKGSLTNLAFYPEFSLDGSTWWPVYDAAQTQIIYTMTASFTGSHALGSNNTNARMQPLAICVPLMRISGTISGTATGSSIAIDATAFSLGGGQD